MEISDPVRTLMVTAVRDAIDADNPDAGKIKFYDKDDVFIVELALEMPCMSGITNGVGTFDNTTPNLRGTVLSGNGGTANRFKFFTDGDVLLITGTCGDTVYTGKDIQFNTRVWADYDNISITSLTFTQPVGTNDYIP